MVISLRLLNVGTNPPQISRSPHWTLLRCYLPSSGIDHVFISSETLHYTILPAHEGSQIPIFVPDSLYACAFSVFQIVSAVMERD